MWRKADVYASFWKPRAICLSSVEPATTCFCAFPIKEKASSWLWQNWFNCICWLQPKSEGLRISCLQVSEYFDRHLAFSHTGGASFCCANVCILQSWRWHWEDPGVGRKSLAAPGRGQPQQIVWTVRQLLIQMRSALCGVPLQNLSESLQVTNYRAEGLDLLKVCAFLSSHLQDWWRNYPNFGLHEDQEAWPWNRRNTLTFEGSDCPFSGLGFDSQHQHDGSGWSIGTQCRLLTSVREVMHVVHR